MWIKSFWESLSAQREFVVKSDTLRAEALDHHAALP